MTKDQLKDFVKAHCGAFLFPFGELLDKIDQLPEPEPKQGELLPFSWPFDKEKYRVVTRDGREVTQLVKFNAKNATHPICCVIGNEIVQRTLEGYFLGSYNQSCNDLFLSPIEPEMVTMWVNCYKDGNYYSFETEERADQVASITQTRIGPAIRVQFPKPTK